MPYPTKFSHFAGFTLVETVVAAAVFLLMLAATDILFRSFAAKADMETVVSGTAQALRHAQANAQNGLGGSAWGVKIFADRAVIFRGESYLSRDEGFDQFYEYPFKIDASGKTEVVFSKIAGLPDSGGQIIITRAQDARNISINGRGTVTY